MLNACTALARPERGMRGYPLVFGLGLAAWAALLFAIIELSRAASLW